jgi:hypothetical protein
MAVPDYFARNAVAVCQAVSGLDEERLASVLDTVRVGITIGQDAHNTEGRALTDLLVRLLARLYPTLIFRAEGDNDLANIARELAARINPIVELEGTPTVEIVIGCTDLRPWASQRIFVGSSGWTATLSTAKAQSCGESDNPFGPGVAACLGASNLFRYVFLAEPHLDQDVRFEILDCPEVAESYANPRELSADFALAGAGAIGNAAVWAFARAEIRGTLAIVDHEAIDLGNLQRYVLAERSDEGKLKTDVASRYLRGSLVPKPHEGTLASFLQAKKHRVDRLLLAVDSARDRRSAQASLPRWIANAWTQPGDLGVSTHDFLDGACICCLYLPDRPLRNEDAIIADALGVTARLMQIRELLYRNDGAPRDLLEAIAAARNIALDRLLPFEGRPLRSLYTEGFCGGAVIPLSEVGAPPTDVHVPLAHQSALAGILLAAAAVRNVIGGLDGSHITQLDVLKPLQLSRTRPAAKDPRGICICQDLDYQEVYVAKFGSREPTSKEVPQKPRSKTRRPKRPARSI